MTVDEVADPFSQLRNEAEERLVSCVCSHPERFAEVAGVVCGEDFSDPFLGQIYQTGVDLFEAGRFSQHQLRQSLRKAGLLNDPSEQAELRKAFSDDTSGADAIYYANEISRIVAVKKLKAELTKALFATDDVKVDPQELIARINARTEAISFNQSSSVWEMGEEVATKVYETHRSNLETQSLVSASTGYHEIDKATGGFFAGQLWQIAARSYMGKTAAALNFALKQLAQNNGVYFASYEMESTELMERLFAAQAGVPLQKFTRGEIGHVELQRLDATCQSFANSPLFMDQKPPDSISSLRARVKLAQNVSDITLVVIDHLGMYPHTDRRVPRHQQLVEVTREMKTMAKDLKLTVMLLNQLNTDADGERPSDKHYAESKGIIANMDVSILLHRESKTSDELLCIGTKSRRTRPFECKLQFDGEIQRIISNPQPSLDF